MEQKLKELYEETYIIWDNIMSLTDFFERQSCPFCRYYHLDCYNCKIDKRLCDDISKRCDTIFGRIVLNKVDGNAIQMKMEIRKGLNLIKKILKKSEINE